MASSVATPLEREFSTIAGISSMNSVNSLGSTTITVQFTLDRKIDAAAQDIQAAIARAGGGCRTSMPRPPSYQKVNPAEQPVLYLALDSDTLPLYTVNEYADTLLAQRISMVAAFRACRSSARRNTPCACRWTPTSWRRARSASTRCRRRSPPATPTCRPGSLDGDKQAFTIQSTGTLTNAADVPADHRGVAQRHRRCGWSRSRNVIDSVDNNKLAAWYNNTRAVILAIQKQPGTNTVEVVDNIRSAAAAVPHARFRPAVNLIDRLRRVAIRSAARSATWSSPWC